MKRSYPLARLGGARAELAESSPRDRTRYGALGGLMLVTAGVGGVAMYMLTEIVFHLTWPWPLLPAIAWMLCILVIDRALLVSFPVEQSRKTILPLLWRLLLAVVIGVVVSTPMTLRIFQPEIDVQVQVMQQELRDELNAKNDADPLVARIPELREEVSQAQQTVASGSTAAAADPAYVAASQDAKALYADWSAKNQDYNKEMQGTGGSLSRGNGEIAQQMKVGVDDAKAAYEHKQAEADELLRAATTAAENAVSAAAAALPALEERLAAATAREATLVEQNESRIAASDGLHNRIDAVFRLAAESPSGFLVHLFVFLFFLFIEITPVLGKWLMSRLPRTQEALALDQRDALILTRADHETGRAVADEEARTSAAAADREATAKIDLDRTDRRRKRSLWENRERDAVERSRLEQALVAARLAAAAEQETGPAASEVADSDIDESGWKAEPVPHEDQSAFVRSDLVGGRYRLVQKLTSPFTELWRAVDVSSRSLPIVAVKMLPAASPGVDQKEWQNAVKNEIDVVRSLPEHPNVMKHLKSDYHSATDQWWFASPWYGPSLHEHLSPAYRSKDTRNRPALGEVIEYVRDAARGVAAAHGAGIAHGDVKPANLVKDDATGAVRVIDFGLARTSMILHKDSSGLAPGTPYYAAPEMTERGDRDHSAELSDVYGLGAVMYFLITGVRPRRMPFHHDGTTVAHIAHDINEGRAYLAALSPQLPEELVSLTVRCLAPTPEQRFGSWDPSGAAKELADELDRIMANWSRAEQNLRVGEELIDPGTTDWERSFYDPTYTWADHDDTADLTPRVGEDDRPHGARATFFDPISQAPEPTPVMPVHPAPRMAGHWVLHRHLSGTGSAAGLGIESPAPDPDATAPYEHRAAPERSGALDGARRQGRMPKRWRRKAVDAAPKHEDEIENTAEPFEFDDVPTAPMRPQLVIFDQDDEVDPPLRSVPALPAGSAVILGGRGEIDSDADPTEPMPGGLR